MESSNSRAGSSAGNEAADAARLSEECNPSQTTKCKFYTSNLFKTTIFVNKLKNSFLFIVKDNEKVALRIKGLPWRVEKEQVSEFF